MSEKSVAKREEIMERRMAHHKSMVEAARRAGGKAYLRADTGGYHEPGSHKKVKGLH